MSVTPCPATRRARRADARGRYDRLRRMLDKACEDKLERRVDEAFFARKRQSMHLPNSRVPKKKMA